LTAEDKKNYIDTVNRALTYHSELNQIMASADKKKDVPVLAETVYRYCNTMENVSSI
jgi:hypothetical protein